ncbi:MAG: hypothetical protein MJ174_10295 [Treponema sp.]|nr:hypothetical protein [Treponema sp.]
MDLQLAYNHIDEYFSKYIESGNETDKSKMLKVICDVINSDYKYKGALANGDFDYLPVLIATNDAIKHFNLDKEESSFHKYLFVCIHNAVNKDIEISKGKDNANLNYNNIKLLKKIKKLMPIYQDNKSKVAEALNITIDKLNELLYSQVSSLDKENESDESESTVADFISSEDLTPEEAFESKEKLQDLFTKFDSAWKELKTVHQGVVSDWLTALILSILEKPDYAVFMENKGEALNFFSKFDFINIAIVSYFYDEAGYILPLTYETIGQLHGITKGAVYKKILVFSEDLKKHLKK